MGVRTRKMPKTIKRVKQTLKGNKGGLTSAAHYDPHDMHTDRENEVLNRTSFYPKYLGSTLVEELIDPEPGANYHNTGLSTKALDRIVRMSRNGCLTKVSLTVSPKGIQVIRLSDRTILLDISMDRVSFCTHDKKYSKVTAFIARNCDNETMECHAFLCDRQKLAKAINVSLSSAFAQSKERERQLSHNNQEEQSGDNSQLETGPVEDNSKTLIVESRVNEQLLLIDNDTDYKITDYRASNSSNLSESGGPSRTISREHSPPPSYGSDDLLSLDFEATSQPIIDDSIEPVMRTRADSDSWAVMAGGGNDDNGADDDLEFSNFARSRSTANLADLRSSVYSAWDI